MRLTDQVKPRFPQIDTPTHIVCGADDTWIPVDRAHRLHALIPDSSLEVTPGAGHLVQLDAPAHLTAEIIRWTENINSSA